jgi:hypothetical protein
MDRKAAASFPTMDHQEEDDEKRLPPEATVETSLSALNYLQNASTLHTSLLAVTTQCWDQCLSRRTSFVSPLDRTEKECVAKCSFNNPFGEVLLSSRYLQLAQITMEQAARRSRGEEAEQH